MAREIIIDGFFLDLEDFNNDYRSTSTYDEIAAEEYITKINRNARTNAREIAENITLAAQCAQVDAIYLLAKIHQESTFYISANSSTGAAGLSQMTGVAIQEVKDQLGIRGSRYARSSVIRSLRNDLKNCLGISAYNELYALYRDKTKYQIKQVYKRDIKQSILAGAIILKIFLTKNYSPNRSLRENYRRALEDYNGESTRAQYAQSIIDKASLIRARFNN
tara:strand:+ start:30593 stop:31255 length:663 start_codon:yes stop_codon:yes gene_type:complete